MPASKLNKQKSFSSSVLKSCIFLSHLALNTWSSSSELLEKYQTHIYTYIAKRKTVFLNASQGSMKTSLALSPGQLGY